MDRPDRSRTPPRRLLSETGPTRIPKRPYQEEHERSSPGPKRAKHNANSAESTAQAQEVDTQLAVSTLNRCTSRSNAFALDSNNGIDAHDATSVSRLAEPKNRPNMDQNEPATTSQHTAQTQSGRRSSRAAAAAAMLGMKRQRDAETAPMEELLERTQRQNAQSSSVEQEGSKLSPCAQVKAEKGRGTESATGSVEGRQLIEIIDLLSDEGDESDGNDDGDGGESEDRNGSDESDEEDYDDSGDDRGGGGDMNHQSDAMISSKAPPRKNEGRDFVINSSHREVNGRARPHHQVEGELEETEFHQNQVQEIDERLELTQDPYECEPDPQEDARELHHKSTPSTIPSKNTTTISAPATESVPSLLALLPSSASLLTTATTDASVLNEEVVDASITAIGLNVAPHDRASTNTELSEGPVESTVETPAPCTPSAGTNRGLADHEQHSMHTQDGFVENNENDFDSPTNAASQLLQRVVTSNYPHYFVEFPGWDSLVLGLLQVEASPTSEMHETVEFLAQARPAIEVSVGMTLDQCVQQLIEAIGWLPRIGSGAVPQEICHRSFGQSLAKVEDMMARANEAEERSVAREVTEAWGDVIDSVSEAVVSLRETVKGDRTKWKDWKQWCSDSYSRVEAQEAVLDKQVKHSEAVLRNAESKATSEIEEMKSLETILNEKIAEFGAALLQCYRERAGAADFRKCSSLQDSLKTQLSANAATVSLQESLLQHHQRVTSSEQERIAAGDVHTFWGSLLKFFRMTRQQHADHVKAVTAKWDAFNEDSRAYLQRTMTDLRSRLIQALVHYLDRSFQVQTDAMDGVKQEALRQKEQEGKFGGFMEFDTSQANTFQTIADNTKREVQEVMGRQHQLWEGLLQVFPAGASAFPLDELDRELGDKHNELWNDAKQPLLKDFKTSSDIESSRQEVTSSPIIAQAKVDVAPRSECTVM